MDRTTQDLAWGCLPREFREEVKKEWRHTDSNTTKRTLEDLYGLHNLTSDAEGEEMLIVPRSKVQELFDTGDKYSCSTLAALFGSKCLPDETKDGTMDETKEPKPAEPKFKAGNRVIYKNTGKVKIVVNITQDGRYVVASPDGKSPYFAQESDLEPYTESKNKDSGFIRAESVKELRIASEETHLRNLSQETANCDKHFDNILKDGFLKERRLNIAAMAMQGILSNAERMNQYGEIAAREPESLTELVARNALRYADALIDKVKKGVNNE